MDKDIFFAQFGHLALGPGGIKKLRNLILQLAVQGKLVEQDPGDEPASVLLHRVIQKRAELLQQKKVKANKKFGKFPGDQLEFELPKGWVFSNLAELGSINPRNEIGDSALSGFVPMPLISQDFGLHHTFEEKKWADIKKGYTHFADGDVGVAKITPCFENSKCCVFSRLPNGVGAGTTELHIFRDELHELNPNYIYIFMKSPWFLDDGQRHMTGSAGQKRVPVDYMAQKPVPLPPLAEQKRIVAKVDELMGLCDELEAQQNEHVALKRDCVTSTLHHLTAAAEPDEINTNWSITQNNFQNWFNDPQTVKTLRATIVQLAVQGKLVPQDPTDEPASVLLQKVADEKEKLIEAKVIKKQKPLPEINLRDEPCNLPRDWKWVRFGDLFMSSEYGTSEKAMATESSGVPVYAMGHIQNRELRDGNFKYLKYESDSLPKLYLKHKDLLFNRTNSYELVGKTAIYWGNDDERTFASYLIRVALFHDHVDCVYANIYLNSPLCRKTQIEPEITKQTNQANFNGTKLKHIIFPLPPLAEQRRIVAKVDELMALCDQLETQIDTQSKLTQDLTASLIHHMTAA
jgi:type I restriction enzyme S subunit